MTLDIVLMATVGVLCLVGYLIELAERIMPWGRRRSRTQGDVLNAIARVEQKISQTDSDSDSRWDSSSSRWDSSSGSVRRIA
jgi:hypothetical protein